MKNPITLWTAGLILAIAMVASAGHAKGSTKTCDGSIFLTGRQCQDHSKDSVDLRKKKSDADGVLFNYFLVAKRSGLDEIEQLAFSVTKDDKQKALAISEKVRTAAIQFVTGGAPRERWSDEVRAVVQRLETVTFSIGEEATRECFEKGDPSYPNAIYNQIEHGVTLCGSIPKAPIAHLVAAVSHELGHAVSPCNMSYPLIRYRDPQGPRDCKTVESDGIGPKMKQTENVYSVDVDYENEDLSSCGIADTVPGSQLKDPTIYRMFSACLYVNNKPAYEKFVAFQSIGLPNLPKKLSPGIQKIADGVRKKTPPLCFSKNEEHFGDSFGAQVFNQWAQQEKWTAGKFKTGIHHLTSIQCIENVLESSVVDPLAYPSANDRIALHLNSPYSRKLFGCEPRSETLCSIKPDTYTSTLKTPDESDEKAKPIQRGTTR